MLNYKFGDLLEEKQEPVFACIHVIFWIWWIVVKLAITPHLYVVFNKTPVPLNT